MQSWCQDIRGYAESEDAEVWYMKQSQIETETTHILQYILSHLQILRTPNTM